MLRQPHTVLYSHIHCALPTHFNLKIQKGDWIVLNYLDIYYIYNKYYLKDCEKCLVTSKIVHNTQCWFNCSQCVHRAQV